MTGFVVIDKSGIVNVGIGSSDYINFAVVDMLFVFDEIDIGIYRQAFLGMHLYIIQLQFDLRGYVGTE